MNSHSALIIRGTKYIRDKEGKERDCPSNATRVAKLCILHFLLFLAVEKLWTSVSPKRKSCRRIHTLDKRFGGQGLSGCGAAPGLPHRATTFYSVFNILT